MKTIQDLLRKHTHSTHYKRKFLRWYIVYIMRNLNKQKYANCRSA